MLPYTTYFLMIPYERHWQQKQEGGGGGGGGAAADDHNNNSNFFLVFNCILWQGGGRLGEQCGYVVGVMLDSSSVGHIQNTMTYHPLKLSLKGPLLLTIYKRVDMLALAGTVTFLIMNITKQA